ncbi:SDR family oxidoreductase [Burkholderia contaminans]|uniref:Short-chain dehydrogenase/reductase SDR n=1 Tax=Burkholderia contaminans TaxID=488447 RepID=A0A6P3CC31_9BURK|nr:SDR family oxidoreductase [Burkholderia contaminans]VWD64976.1 short-chain dehydrogenase/reductase SDR [Burkholderia contaminans]
MTTLLKDDVVLVTGGGSGLGAGVARHCLAEGAKLAVMDISGAKLDSLRTELGDEPLLFQGDATKLADLQACREAILGRFGRLNAFIGAQGIWDGNVPLRDIPIEKFDEAFDEVFHINVKSYMLSARVFLDLLEKEQGAIVLTGSSGASYCADGGGVLYTATKHATLGIVRQLAFEFAPTVRVNGVAPSIIMGSQLRGPQAFGMEKRSQADIPREMFQQGVDRIWPLTWLPEAKDYGPLYALLASRHSRVMTGTIVAADQGLMNRNVLTPVKPGASK